MRVRTGAAVAALGKVDAANTDGVTSCAVAAKPVLEKLPVTGGCWNLVRESAVLPASSGRSTRLAWVTRMPDAGHTAASWWALSTDDGGLNGRWACSAV